MNKSKESEVNATDVGRHFLTKYYNAMAHDTDQVLHFYSDSSSVKRFGKSSVTGLENIKTELAKNRLDNLNVRVFNTICLNSINDSIIIQVSGEFVEKSGEGRAFIQNVILASQGPGKYYVFNDMIEWLDDLYPTLGLQKLDISAGGTEAVHFNGQTGKHHDQAVHRSTSTNTATNTYPEVHQNGQLQQQQQQLHHHTAADLIEPRESQQPIGHSVGNIQSFINAAASQQKQQQQQQREEHESTPPHFKQAKEVPQREQQREQHFQSQSERPHAPKPESQAPVQQQQQQQQAPPQPVAPQIPEDTGPRTWAKLVSGQIKSNGLPPPTQPPPAVVEHLQQTDKKIKTQPETQPQRDGQWRTNKREGGGGQWRGGEGGGKREGGGNQWRGEKRENRGGEGGEREGGDKPFRSRRQGGNRDGGNRDGGNRDGNREGGNREGGNREGGNREGGNREGGHKYRSGQNGGDRQFRQNQNAGQART